MVMHGGPGAGSHTSSTRFFDPQRYRVILFDQRGCGKSTPSASEDDARAALTDNTTQHLIDDVSALRHELNIDGKMHVFGGSWGSTLALAYTIAQPATVQTLILRGVFLCRRVDVDYFFQGNAAEFAADPLAMPVPGTYLDFPTAWRHFVDTIPPEDRGDVVKGLAKIFAAPPRTEAERERLAKAASACVAWEGSASRLDRDENSHGQPNEKYALTAARILVHYMISGGFLDANGEANRDNNYILDHLVRPPRLHQDACICAKPVARRRDSSPQRRSGNFVLEARKPLTSTRCPHRAREIPKLSRPTSARWTKARQPLPCGVE